MKTTIMAINVDKENSLIVYVKDRPCLHDKNHPEYKNIMLSQAMWKEIGEILDMTAKKAQEDWKKLRSQFHAFQRKLKRPTIVSGTTSGRRPYFRHEVAMGFLKGTVEPNESTYSNLDEDVEKEQSTDSNDNIHADNISIHICDENELPDILQGEDLEASCANQRVSQHLTTSSKKISEGIAHGKFGEKRKKLDTFDKDVFEITRSDDDEFDLSGKLIAVKLRHLSKLNRKVFLELQFQMYSLIHNAEMSLL